MTALKNSESLAIRRMMAQFVYFVLPIILMVIGLPNFLVLVVTSLAAILFIADVPRTQSRLTCSGGSKFPAARHALFVLAGEIMARGGIARRVVAWVVSIIGGVRGSLGGDDGRVLGIVRRDGAHVGRHRRCGRPTALSVADVRPATASASRSG